MIDRINKVPCGGLVSALAALSLFLRFDATHAQDTLPEKQAGVVRIGIVKPKVQVGADDAPQAADAVRNILAEYLQGPTIEVALLSARLSSQYSVEAKQADCDYVLSSSLTHRRGSQDSGLGTTLGKPPTTRHTFPAATTHNPPSSRARCKRPPTSRPPLRPRTRCSSTIGSKPSALPSRCSRKPQRAAQSPMVRICSRLWWRTRPRR